MNTGLAHQDKCRICGYKVPLYFWFVLSGALCDVVQALIDYMVSRIYTIEYYRPTVCWVIGYTLVVVVRHSSHRFLVFGEFEGSYCSSLGRTYMTYSSSIVISTMANHVLVSVFFFTHRQAWILTMLWTGIYNYFALKSTWKSKPIVESKSAVSPRTIDL